jgi:hypothetical protein
MDYITIATTGNAIDFGDLTVAREIWLVFLMPQEVYLVVVIRAPYSNVIDYITVATTGNATDFGDLTVARYFLAGASNATRGVFAGGYTGGESKCYRLHHYCHNRKCY